jgi:hypothetical protein
MAADLAQMQLHGFSIGPWQREDCAFAASRTDGAEEIHVLVALIGWLAGTGALLRPQADFAVLLSQSCFVLETNLDWHLYCQVSYVSLERVGKIL